MQPIIYFATDHAGFALKNELIAFVEHELNFEVVDCGAYTYDDTDDFTEFIAKAVREVSADSENKRAIILGGSGQGEAMLANRFHNVRATVYYGGNDEIVRLSREHNDANVLSLGARFLDSTEAKRIVSMWLYTPHSPVVKYDRRNNEIDTLGREVTTSEKTVPYTNSLVPSLPATSFAEIASLFDTLEGTISGIQIDIADGVFVPTVSWPFTEGNVELALVQLSSYTSQFEVEIDCMCMNPERFLDLFVSIGIRRVIVHIGSTEAYEECIAHAKNHGYILGFAILNTTPLEMLKSYIDKIDFVQVMGIEHIGVQGQPFDDKTLETVMTLRGLYPQLEIAVDGAVNTTTLPWLVTAGANRFAPGSAVVSSEDQVRSFKQLAALVGL